MKKLFLFLLLSLSFIGSTYADFQDGLDAYKIKDYETALTEWTILAEQGLASAQYKLGYMYLLGMGITQDVKQAIYWFTKAAEQGHISSQFELGKSYISGAGVNQDLKKAIYWHTKAAEQGHPSAQYDLGRFYIDGNVVAKDLEQGDYWLTKAGHQGRLSKSYKRIAMPQNASAIGTSNWRCNSGYKQSEGMCIVIDTNNDIANSYKTGYGWECYSGYFKSGNSCIEIIKIPANASASGTGWKCNSGYKKSGDICEANFLNTNIPTKEILLINSANLIGQEQYKTTSLENLSCKSSIVVTKGGGINVKQVESSTYQKSSSYSQGYTDVPNQRYFELQSKIRQAKYELQDVNSNNATGYNNWTALLAGVLTGVRKGQVQDKIKALEKKLRNTRMTIRKENKATYNVTGQTVSFEKAQRFKWMLINCINGEVSINEVTAKNNSGKISLFQGIHPNDIGNLKSKNEKAKNKLKSWSDKPLLSMIDINGNKSKVLTTSTINTDNISIASQIKWFLSTQ